ncbi:MAG TPA: sce7725 family protein [Anaerolineae bacterium]|nr:sce7725 family protein [Anaerolineae bacterium]
MYFPYLRGKQFELIAIRELIENNLIARDRIVPVIEPVKLSSTLKKTFVIAEENTFRLALILNPEVGDVVNKTDDILSEFLPRVQNNSLYFGYITNKGMVNEIQRLMAANSINNGQIILVHVKNTFANEYNLAFPEIPPAFNLIPDQRTYGRKIRDNKVLFVDHFIPQKRNSDYANEPDEFFSEDHLYYEEEGFKGFSDYCTIGYKFAESGFRPYAVVIHITYFDDDDNIRIRHFVSDTNEDISDTPRKFYEALEKLIIWKNHTKIDTYALSIFQKHYDNQTYPGLGSIKKLSIMHHIELVNRFLGEQ